MVQGAAVSFLLGGAVGRRGCRGDDELASITAALNERYPSAKVVPYSALTGAGLADLLETWQAEASWSDDLVIDYDRYAAAEAQLAWLNQRFDVQATGSGFSPAAWAQATLGKLVELIGDPASIGHAKIIVDTPGGLTKMSLTGTSAEPSADSSVETPARAGTAYANARVVSSRTSWTRRCWTLWPTPSTSRSFARAVPDLSTSYQLED